MANTGTIAPEKTIQDSVSRAPVLITAVLGETVDLTRLLDTLHGYDEQAEVLGVEQTEDGRGFRLLVDVHRGPTGVLPLRVATAPFNVKVETAKGEDITIRPTAQRPTGPRPDYSLTVLGDPVTARALARITAEVVRLGGGIDAMRGVAHRPVTGLELCVSLPQDTDREEIRSALTGAAATAGVGISVASGRVDPAERRLVMFDVDATFILDEVIEKLAAKAGKEAEVKQLTKAAIGDRNSDFAALLEQRVALLAGLDSSALDEVADSLTLTPGARAAVVMLEEMGHEWGLASGGFTRIIRRLMENEGLEPSFVEANELEVVDGKLTGRLVGKIVDRAEKERVLRRRAAEYGIPMEQTVAVGDGGNDGDGVKAAGVGVAFCAQQTLCDVADAVVPDRDLVAVMYAAGYTEADVQVAYPNYVAESAQTVGRVRTGSDCIRVAHSTHHAASPRGDHRPVGGPGRGESPARARGRARSRKADPDRRRKF